MKQEIETVIHTEQNARVSVSDWDEGCVWLHIMVPGGSCNAVLTHGEAQRMMEGLKAILEARVEA